MSSFFKIILVLLAIITLSACDHPEKLKQATTSNAVSKAVNHSNRPIDDFKRDQNRSPEKVLKFFNIQSGESVIELLAAGGYYVELLSRCVGNTGTVYMQNNRKFYEFQTDQSVIQRLKDDRLANVVRWDKELTDLQLTPASIDKAFMILVLHDLYWMEEDVSQVIQSIYKILKPGGIFAIIDHAAEPGSGDKHALDMRGLHRIDKDFVIQTMLQAGFLFDSESHALRHSSDDRSKAFFSPELKGKPTDRFMLRFKKPD